MSQKAPQPSPGCVDATGAVAAAPEDTLPWPDRGDDVPGPDAGHGAATLTDPLPWHGGDDDVLGPEAGPGATALTEASALQHL